MPEETHDEGHIKPQLRLGIVDCGEDTGKEHGEGHVALQVRLRSKRGRLMGESISESETWDWSPTYLWIKEHFDVLDVICSCLKEVCPGQVIKVPLRHQHLAPCTNELQGRGEVLRCQASCEGDG